MEYPTIEILTDFVEVQPELQYLCKLFSSLLCAHFQIKTHIDSIKTDSIFLSYCRTKSFVISQDSSKVSIRPNDCFWKEYSYQKVLKMRWDDWDGTPVLVNASSEPGHEGPIESFSVEYDFFASTFFLITRLEEVWGGAALDRHSRHLYKESQHDEQSIDRPLINEYAQKLKELLNNVYGLSIKPRQEKPAALISHDIDLPYYYTSWRTELSEIKNFFRGVGKYKNTRDLLRLFLAKLGLEQDPYETFDYIRRQEEMRRMVFYLVYSHES